MKTIYLKQDEEITSIIDQLAQAKGSDITLVAPEGASLFQSLINLKLLKREADNLGKNIILVTADELGRQLAPKAGLATKHSSVFEMELEENQEKDISDVLIGETNSFSEEKEVDLQPKISLVATEQMADIIRPSSNKPNFSQRFLRKGIQLGSDKVLKKVIRSPEIDISGAPNPNPNPISNSKSVSVPTFNSKKVRWMKFSSFFVIFIALALVVAGFSAYLILPKTEIIISPKTETINFELLVIGSDDISQIDLDLNKIPIQVVKIEESLSKEFQSTGEKQLSENARGAITVFNEFSSAPQTLVETTRFLSKEGKLFRAVKTITVPGAGVEEGKIVPKSIDVDVVADELGPDYNIGPSEFTIPGFEGTVKYTSFYGRSKKSMTGGSNEKVKIILAEDLEKAKNILTEELNNLINGVLEGRIPQNLKLIEGGIGEGEVEVSGPAEESPADKFIVEAKIEKRALLFNENDLRDLVDLNLSSQLAPDRIALSGTQEIVWEKPVIDWEQNKVSLTLQVQENVSWPIDLESLKKDLVGQDETVIRKYLTNRPEIERAKVTFWPFWAKRVPLDGSKIEIRVD